VTHRSVGRPAPPGVDDLGELPAGVVGAAHERADGGEGFGFVWCGGGPCDRLVHGALPRIFSGIRDSGTVHSYIHAVSAPCEGRERAWKRWLSVSQLRIRTLGGLDVEVDGRPLSTPVPAKGRALLTYLAVVGGRADRSRLAGLLWSDQPEASARQNLRHVLTRLRRALDHVRADRTTVWLDGAWSADAADVEAMSAGEASSADPAEVLDVVRGGFLDGIDVAGRRAVRRVDNRHPPHLRSVTLALLGGVVARALAGVIPSTSGITAARRVLELEPTDEAAHRALMRPLRRCGADVGRDAELARLDRLLTDPSCRLVTVVGVGGVGKTRLAVEFARAT